MASGIENAYEAFYFLHYPYRELKGHQFSKIIQIVGLNLKTKIQSVLWSRVRHLDLALTKL